MSSSTLTIEKKEGVATLTLNRPEAMNALSFELRGALVDAFRELQSDDEIRVVVLTGAGRAFCAGLDLKELSQQDDAKRDIGGRQNPVAAMAAFEGPIIGAINGHAITGGFELALSCDLMIASSRAVFADTHIRVGIMPGWGLSQKLSRIVGIGQAKEISLSGNFVDAERACAIGLVNRVVAPEELMNQCEELAREMASCDPQMLRGYKRLIDEGYGMNFRDALQLEASNTFGRLGDMKADVLAERRKQVTERGRSQNR
ncbi:MAG: enoyl-CoA hydratase [Deltaproteobacteria bacterium]|nr:enoyl-CoA hydratase [Deltaproteobacteria bacterium]MBW2388381.1 enoyl-CoA hydratase [Deltaproteobacteria bacterium]